jgi:molybdate transport system ATP-binding protein
LRSGGITVLRGDSGSGKTTLANLLSGAIAPQKGRIVSDDDVWFDSDSRINVSTQSRGIGFVIQTHRLFSNLTVEETIRFPVLFGKRKPLLAFDELVELLSIEKLLERRPKSFPDSCWAFRAQAAKSASP